MGPRLPRHLESIEETEGMISLAEADLLYHLAKQTTDGCILEIGSYRGRSTVALAHGSLAGNKAPVFAIEPHEDFQGALGGSFGPRDRAAFFTAMLDTSAYEIVRLVNLSSEVVAPGWKLPIGLLWIDGDHTFRGVARDWQCWSPHLTAGCRVALDDALDPNLGPRQLIEDILAAEKYRLAETVGKIAVLEQAA